MKYRLAFLTLLMFYVLVGCAQKEASTEKTNYEETKKMVVDILKTDEGKKAIQEIMTDDKTKQNLVMDQATVTQAIEKNLTSDKAKKFWEKAFKDPKFAAAYAKSLEEEHKKLLKDLMKDPDYVSKVMEIWQDPEMQKELTKILKSKKVTEEFKKSIIETVDSPLVKAKLQDILLKAAEELPAETEKKKGGSSQTDTSSSGGGSGNEQGGGGGG
ncbi:spore germination lipoprotein GerD [Bacillus massiliigorillae]|uniref:spore germination lipoprotein GerD n=1 Tax=Bacillus massiliigorillae TaxID=1243664 RepID=UPI00039E0BE6|nr:spore germination lipoprotein GerD [Bacillus massiliigorillae]